MLFVSIAIAQTQKELDDAMKKLQDVMKNLPPEAKQMMDSLGLNDKLTKGTKDLKSKGITDKQIKEAVEDANRLVPKRNDKLILQSNKRLKDETELKSFLVPWCSAIQKGLNPKSLTRFDALVTEMKQKTNGNNITYPGLASLLMISDKPCLAMAAFTKEFIKNGITDYNDINNFSVLCNTLGGPQVALPILNFMNKKFPDNPVILNNIGQAWYTCGERDSAELFLDKSIRILAYNPEANETICKIYKDEGKDKEAEDALKKSFKAAYSHEKEEMAKKYKIKITNEDYNLPSRLKNDPLGFLNIQRPDFQVDVMDYHRHISVAGPWNEEIESQLAKLKDDYDKLGKKLYPEFDNDYDEKKAIGDFMTKINQANSQSEMLRAVGKGPYFLKITSFLSDNIDRTPEALLLKCSINLKANEDQFDKDAAVFYDIASQKKNWGDTHCTFKEKEYLMTNINPLYIAKCDKDIHEYVEYCTDALYYYMYGYDERIFEISKMEMKINFLKLLLRDANAIEKDPSKECYQPLPPTNIKLAKFEDTHCPITPINFQEPTGTINLQWDCTGSHLFIDSPIFKYKDVSDGNGNSITTSVWIGLSVGKTLTSDNSNIRVSAKITDGAYVEFKGDQITDCGMTIGGELKAGINLQNLKVAKKGDDEVTQIGRLTPEENTVSAIKTVDKNWSNPLNTKVDKETIYMGKTPSYTAKAEGEVRLSFMDTGKSQVNKVGANIFGYGAQYTPKEGIQYTPEK